MTVFTMIINGDIPGRFVWRDEVCVAFLSINPTSHGHTLVVPIAEVDHWADLEVDAAAHLMRVAHTIAGAQMAALSPGRVGLLIAGFEVPHTHLHVIPMNGMGDLNLGNAAANPDAGALDEAQASIVAALVAQGHETGVS